MRLDFESFDINGLSDSAEQKDTDPKAVTECQDKFTITVSSFIISTTHVIMIILICIVVKLVNGL